MASDPLLPLLDALLRMRNFDAAELEAMLRQLPADSPDAQPRSKEVPPPLPATPEQPTSTLPNTTLPEPRPVGRETILVGFGDDDAPLDPGEANADEWSLPTDEEPSTPQLAAEPVAVSSNVATDSGATLNPAPEPVVPPDTKLPERKEESPDFEWGALAPSPAENKPAIHEDETDRQLRQIMAWSGKGLFVWVLFLASFFFAALFLRSAPQPPLAAKPKPAVDKAREKAAQRRESKWAEGETMLAKEELIATEDAQLAMTLANRPRMTSDTGVPNLRLDRNEFPRSDEAVAVFPVQEFPPLDVPDQEIPRPTSPPPSSYPEPPASPPPSSAASNPLPVIIPYPGGGGGFGGLPIQHPRTSVATTHGHSSPSNAAANVNHPAQSTHAASQTTSVSHSPQTRTAAAAGHGRSR